MYRRKKVWKPKTPDPFINFPNDKLYEICESLDDVSLANFSRTSKRVQSVCQGELLKRKERRDFLLSELIGSWIICINVHDYYLYIRQSENPNNLTVEMEGNDEPLLDDMIEKFDYDVLIQTRIGEIGKSLEDLESLFSEILRRGYKKLEDYWGLYHEGSIYFHRGYYAKIRIHPQTNISMIKEKLLEYADEMNLKLDGSESAEELKDLIIEELTKRNQMFFCGEKESLEQ